MNANEHKLRELQEQCKRLSEALVKANEEIKRLRDESTQDEPKKPWICY